MPIIEALAVNSGIHGKTLAGNPDLIPVHNNLGSSFFLYRNLISAGLTQQAPVTSAETEILLAELHGNMSRYWYESFNPAMQDGYRLGSSKLSDEFVQAAAGKQTGEAASAINKVSDKAFIEGYNAALNKGWERAVAWERISEAYGLDTAQMRKWVTGYPVDGYHPDAIPKASKKSLMKMLFDRSERIAGHELWSALQMAKQLEFTEQIQDGMLPTDTHKVWTTAQDELVCPTCGPMDGASLPVDEQFTTQDGYFYAPPAHINCRCSIQMFLPNVVTKRMGSDKYDRDKKGQFSSNEGRSVSPFITESEPNNWPTAGFVAARPSDQIPEEIDHKQEKKDAEEIIGHLRNSEIDEHVDPITQRDAKENEKLNAQTKKQVQERTQEMLMAQEEEQAQQALQFEEEQAAIALQEKTRRNAARNAARKKKKASEAAEQEEFNALFDEAKDQRAQAEEYFNGAKARSKATTLAEIDERSKEDDQWIKLYVEGGGRIEDIADLVKENLYGHFQDIDDLPSSEFPMQDSKYDSHEGTGRSSMHASTYTPGYDSEKDKAGKRALEDARAKGLTIERITENPPKPKNSYRVGHVKTHIPQYDTKTYKGRPETDIIKRLKSLFNKQVR